MVNMKTDLFSFIVFLQIEMRRKFILLAAAAAKSVSCFSFRATPAGTVNLSSSVERDVYSMAVSCNESSYLSRWQQLKLGEERCVYPPFVLFFL